MLALGLLAVGSAVHFLTDTGSYAFMSDQETSGLNRFQADIATGTACFIWANSTTRTDALKISGSYHRFEGCVHSNWDLSLTGSHDRFNRTVRYAGDFKNNNASHLFAFAPLKVPAEDFPVTFTFRDYAPGGRAALAAEQARAYHLHTGMVTLTSALLKDGLHYIQGSALVDASGITANVTLVATGSITVAGDTLRLKAYTDGLLFASRVAGSNTIHVNGEGSHFTGAIYAPRGDIHVSGYAHRFVGQVLADTIQVSGANSVFIARSPGVILQSVAIRATTTGGTPVPDRVQPAAAPPVPSPGNGTDPVSAVAPEGALNTSAVFEYGVSVGHFDSAPLPGAHLVITPLEGEPLVVSVSRGGITVAATPASAHEVVLP